MAKTAPMATEAISLNWHEWFRKWREGWILDRIEFSLEGSQTRQLSKRWTDLWNYSPSLNLDDEEFESDNDYCRL